MTLTVYDRLHTDPPEDCPREWVMARVCRQRLSPAWLLECELDMLDRGWQPEPEPWQPDPEAPSRHYYTAPEPGPSFRMRHASPGPFKTLDRRPRPPPPPVQEPPQPGIAPALLAYRARRAAIAARKEARAEWQRREQQAKRRHYMTHEPFQEWMRI